jgi:metal-dependent amidase/aminoacylase/carboxypeptidase family protein
VTVLFQPAEETGDGALGMVEGGLLDLLPAPEVALGQHVILRRLSIPSYWRP